MHLRDPAMLSNDELDAVLPLALALQVSMRAPYVEAVESALAGYAVHGPGLAHRIAAQLQREFSEPPRVTNPQLLSDRKLASVR
jgi:hypothetical protein